MILVSTNPGKTQLTRQKSTHSTARDFASWTTAALDALYYMDLNQHLSLLQFSSSLHRELQGRERGPLQQPVSEEYSPT